MVMQTLQIRLTKGLIQEIQKLVDRDIYSSTSEAVRDSVRRLVTKVETPINIPEEPKEVRKTIKKLDKEVKKQFKNPTGTLDYYPEDNATKNKVFEILKQTALRFGFKEIDSPIIETIDLLKAKQGDEIKKQIFTIEKKGDEEFAIRAEFTPSFARMFIAKQKEIQKPVKWFCIDKVLRYERPQQGRLREFFQFNCEMYGSSKPESDAEIINLVIASLKNLGLDENDFFVKVNNRELLQGMLLEIIEKEKLDDVFSIIDKRQKIPEEEFEEELIKLGLKEKVKEIVKLIY
jgi:histidyl-tRNA synthetase